MDKRQGPILLKSYADLFAGIGGFSLAIQREFPKMKCRYFSEIDKFAIQTYEKHFPKHTRNVGDILKIAYNENGDVNFERIDDLPFVDLMTAGSPCQDLSIQTADRQGLRGKKSSLFFAFAEIVKRKRPKYFILENVASMPKNARDEISRILDVEPMEISSDFICPQIRRRLYWFNWKLDKSALWNRNIRDKKLVRWSKSGRVPGPNGETRPQWKQNERGKWFEEREYQDGKANTLTGGFGCSGQSTKTLVKENGVLRPLTPEEAEIIQTFPRKWTSGVSYAQRYKQIGNAVTVQVIQAILRGLK